MKRTLRVMIWLPLMAALCCGTAWAQDQQAQKPSGADAFRQAYKLTQGTRDAETYNKVIDLCEQGLQDTEDPKFVAYGKNLAAWAYNGRGEERLDAGDVDKALEDFNAAVKYDGKQAKYVHNRAFCHATKGDLENAVADFSTVLELDPEYTKARFHRGEAYFLMNDLDKAKQDYTAAIRLDSRNADAYNARGFVSYLQGDYRAAFSDYNQALRINNRHPGALTNRGDAYADTGQYDQALRDYNGALAVDPEYHRAYASAGWLRATCPDSRVRRTDLALRSARRAVELGGESPRYLSILAAALARSGNYKEAVDTQKKANDAAGDMASEKELDRYKQQLAQYEAGKPYTDTLQAQGQGQGQGQSQNQAAAQ